MDNWKETVWRQFGASIDMLENAIRECPEKVWGDKSGFHEFWYMVFHTLFWLDYYLSETKEEFQPPDPYPMTEMDPAGAFPDRVYTKEEMLAYLEHDRQKTRARIAGLTEETANETTKMRGGGLTVAELMIYNMRHVQHHAAQLNLLMRQQANTAPRWVSIAKSDLG